MAKIAASSRQAASNQHLPLTNPFVPHSTLTIYNYKLAFSDFELESDLSLMLILD
jgi:hypothetical protein